MSLKSGISYDIVSQNIKEMMAAGHSMKEAVASALATKHRSKKMSMGGEMEPSEDQRTMGEMQEEAAFKDNELSPEDFDGNSNGGMVEAMHEAPLPESADEIASPMAEKGLSPEARKAILDRKNKRKYGMA